MYSLQEDSYLGVESTEVVKVFFFHLDLHFCVTCFAAGLKEKEMLF